MDEPTKPSIPIVKVVSWFVLTGGIGIPLLFLATWELLLMSRQSTESLIEIMVWFESFRVMFWPPAMFLIVNAPDSTASEVGYFLALMLLNACIYAAIGLSIALTPQRRTAQFAVGLSLLAAMFGINVYWSEHLASFVIAAIVVASLLALIFRRTRWVR
jgi:hypothetical protein